MPVITVDAFSGENAHTVVGRATHNSVYLRIEFMTRLVCTSLVPRLSPCMNKKLDGGLETQTSLDALSVPSQAPLDTLCTLSKTPLDTICVSAQTALDTICDLSWTP